MFDRLLSAYGNVMKKVLRLKRAVNSGDIDTSRSERMAVNVSRGCGSCPK